MGMCGVDVGSLMVCFPPAHLKSRPSVISYPLDKLLMNCCSRMVNHGCRPKKDGK